MSLLQKLTSFQDRRRFPDWQPKPPTAPNTMPLATTDTICRIVNLLDLEITVGSWVNDSLQALSKEDQAIARLFIERNSQDEHKHDQAMRYLSSYVGNQSEDPAARVLVNKWQKEQPSFALAYALEMGVFMTVLPWLTKNGDMYCARISQWIADDEGVHVLTNRELASICKQPITKDMGLLVVQTLSYIFKDDLINKRALRRVLTGTDEQMMNESVAVTPAFFEQNDKRSVVY